MIIRGVCAWIGPFWDVARSKVPWTAVRVFGNLSYFNISYGVLFLVPIVHELYVRGVPIMIWFGAPKDFPITLLWAYGASLCFAGAILLYQAFCPSEIKRYPDHGDLSRAEFETFKRADPHHRVEMVLGQLTSEDDEEVRRRIENLHRQWLRASSESERGQAKLDLDELLNELHGHAVQAVLQRRHQRANLSWVGLRWLSMLLYLAGISILVVLLINRSLEVFRDYREGYVIIKSNMEGEKLRLSAYTFLADEFVMLENVLKGSGASASYGSLPPDGQRREGRAYWVFGAAIEKFSQAIGGRFDDAGVFSTTGNGGQNYACREKKVGAGDGKGCENITAVDSSAAMVACGLVSQQKGWDYGKATPGVCRRP